MTHPDEQSLSVVVGALVHRPITIVVQPLGVRCELMGVARFAKGTGDELIERSPSLRALLCEVVLTPIFTLRPEMLWAERTRETFIGHDVGHASFGVQFACLPLVVLLRGNSPIRTMTAHAVVGRRRDVDLRSEFGNQLAKAIVEHFGRIALVATAVEHDARMLPDFQHHVAGVLHEEFVVVRVGAVGRISQPEVLENHHTIAVASLVELAVANLSHPVADAVQMHVAMIAHGCVIFAATIAEVVLRESPVAAHWHEAHTIDKNLQMSGGVSIGDFSNSSFKVERGGRRVERDFLVSL